MARLLLIAATLLPLCCLPLPVAASGAIYFNARVEGTGEVLSSYLEFAQE